MLPVFLKVIMETFVASTFRFKTGGHTVCFLKNDPGNIERFHFWVRSRFFSEVIREILRCFDFWVRNTGSAGHFFKNDQGKIHDASTF